MSQQNVQVMLDYTGEKVNPKYPIKTFILSFSGCDRKTNPCRLHYSTHIRFVPYVYMHDTPM